MTNQTPTVRAPSDPAPQGRLGIGSPRVPSFDGYPLDTEDGTLARRIEQNHSLPFGDPARNSGYADPCPCGCGAEEGMCEGKAEAS
jgi:hypothetical protein